MTNCSITASILITNCRQFETDNLRNTTSTFWITSWLRVRIWTAV